jgi:hypothetical protein
LLLVTLSGVNDGYKNEVQLRKVEFKKSLLVKEFIDTQHKTKF